MVGAIWGAPFWVLVFLWIHTGWVKLVFVAIAGLTVLNILSLTWRIRHAERR